MARFVQEAPEMFLCADCSVQIYSNNIFWRHPMKYLSLACLPLLIWSTVSQAIPFSYGEATHRTTKWQELANIPAGDEYGVSWSTDGLNWGRDTDLYVGQTVSFKFNMHKKNVGTHYADHLKAWVDWGQNGSFEASDKIAYSEHLLSDEPALGTNLTPTIPDFEFYSGSFLLTTEEVGDLWLRALVTCSESIVRVNGGSWNDQWTPDYVDSYDSLITPVSHYYQGETEEWKLTVHSVPEPAISSLFGLVLLGLVLKRRKVV